MVTHEHHVALVEHLVESTEPIRRIWSVRTRMTLLLVGWSAGAMLIAYLWPRADLSERFRDPDFTTGLILLATATTFTTLMALRCAVPGRAPTRLEGAAGAFLITCAAVALAMDSRADHTAVEGWLCSLRTIAIAALPWSMLLIAIRRGAPVHALAAGAYAATAALLFATTVLRMACPADGSRHWLVWHFAVVPLATLLVTPLAAHWLRSWRHV